MEPRTISPYPKPAPKGRATRGVPGVRSDVRRPQADDVQSPLRWDQRGENTWAAHPWRIYANWDGLYRLYEAGRFVGKFERLKEAQRAADEQPTTDVCAV